MNAKTMRKVALEICQEASIQENLDNQKLNTIKKKVVKKHRCSVIPTNIQLLTQLNEHEAAQYGHFLLTKPTRTGSGVAVVSIMAMPLGCPHGKCVYCPGGPNSAFGSVPQSYTGREPATMRAIRNQYDPYLQIMNRLEQYVVIGQVPEKVELILMGGTFPAYPRTYRDDFIYYCYKAMNDFSRLCYTRKEGRRVLDLQRFKHLFSLPGDVTDKKRIHHVQQRLRKEKTKHIHSLEEEQAINEQAAIKCIGLTIETKPDWGRATIGKDLLRYGATRIELGVQTLYDKVLRNTHRGHSLQDTVDSFQELKDLGFKINAHVMPGLPGVTKKQDISSLRKLFADKRFRPDMLKVYPTMVFPQTPLYEAWKKGTYQPLTTQQATDIIVELKRIVPPYCRIMRLQRDIPTSLGKGVDRNNLRQYVKKAMEEKGWQCTCIRCREIKQATPSLPVRFSTVRYQASKGQEYFISLLDANSRLVGFVRLRFPAHHLQQEITSSTGLIRELHVYGKAVSIGRKGKTQHAGFGTLLMHKAEALAKKHGKTKLVVISGVGVRGYYRKLGYKKEGPYMARSL